jgi:hypothetical protein
MHSDGSSELQGKLLHAFEALWTPERLATLSKVAAHARQFEAWWKWELATFLWELAEDTGITVFVESHARSDILLANEKVVRGVVQVDHQGATCIPIELKTTGTWWGVTDAAISKALGESDKKRLDEDLRSLAGRARRAVPFGVVALLVTDVTGDDAALEKYGITAKTLAYSAGITTHAQELRLRNSVARFSALQLVWTL